MALNVTKEYNVLNGCKYIRNQDRCQNDSNKGYEVLFNQSTAGWDVYGGMDVTYAEGYFLWGIVTDTQSYISRESDFEETFEADYFGDFEVDMLVRLDPTATPDAPDSFTGRIRWKTRADVTWPLDAYEDFEVIPDGVWHRYRVNLLEKQLWVGDCSNFIFYPMIDGLANIEVLVKRFAFRSDFNYRCKQPACMGHRTYSHPCPHIGTHARAYALTRANNLSIDDTKTRIVVSIDGYSPRPFDIDLSHATDPHSVAQSITMKLNLIGIGGFKYAECRYDEIEQVFSIYSGTKGSKGSVQVFTGGVKDATQELGFFNSLGNATWKFETGKDPADGYQPYFFRLPATSLYRLASSTTTVIDYNPSDPLVEVGRRGLETEPLEQVFPEGFILGYLMIDVFGGCSYYGTLNQIQFRGSLPAETYDAVGSQIFLLRPVTLSSYAVIYSTPLTTDDLQGPVYSKSVEWVVRPGDVLALWQCLPAMHGIENLPPEQLYKYSWIEKRLPHLIAGDVVSFTTKDLRFYGYESLPVYGYSSARMLDIGIETELRYEYGVSHVAVVGDPSSDYFSVNLMDLSSTRVEIGTSSQAGVITSVAEANFNIEPPITDEYFYINFWFPGAVKGVARTVMCFPETNNLRSFCWEWYAEVKDRKGLVWGTQFPSIATEAPYLGSAVGWIRMPDPVLVTVDAETDYSSSFYLGWNYVTDDATDYFPGLSEDEQQTRVSTAKTISWNQLDQVWGGNGIQTRALRLYCWQAASAEIASIGIYAIFPNAQSLIHSIEAFGISGPMVFETERYMVTDVRGDKYSSSRISRAQTQDYLYGMDFSLQDAGNTVVAPVGTTLFKFQINIGGLATRIEQIKIIPQHLAVQVKAAGDEPVEEIRDLSWGMPSDGREWSYGPTKSYKVCNDREHEAKLLLGVASPLATDQSCVFYSPLSSYESLTDPYRGLTSYLMPADDYLYTNDRAINYRSIVYGILPTTPKQWYSSTTGGAVWHTLVSGSPFTETTLWSEPANPYRLEWSIYNWAKATNVSVTSGSLEFDVESRVLAAEGPEWRNVTYFQPLTKTDYLLIETQVSRDITAYDSVDATAGLVLFDNTNRTNYIRIERYTGNNITTSGYLSYAVPHGDYISYGEGSQYSVSGGFTVIDLGVDKKTNLLLRMAKDQNRVETAYRNPWGSWTTVSSYDISGWSDNLRMGLFAGAVDRIGDASERSIRASFNYVAYKRSSDRVTDFFDYTCDFEDLSYSMGDWTSYHPQNTDLMVTSPSGISIRRYQGPERQVFFTNELLTPALGVVWGSPYDLSTVKFNLVGYNPTLLGSGIYSAGILLRDSVIPDNYIQFSLTGPDHFEIVQASGIANTITLPYQIDSASGIWIRLHKTSGMFVPAYSYDGAEFTAVSGYRIGNWSQSQPLSLIFSSDLPEIRFSNLEIGNSPEGTNAMMAEFTSDFALYNIWGRGGIWDNLMYYSSDQQWVSEKPLTCHFIKFTKDPADTIDFNAIQFMPDPWASRAAGKGSVTYEIDSATEMLFDRTAQAMPAADPGSWAGTSSVKGLPQSDYPVLIVDLGRSYELGRVPLVNNTAYGRVSRSITGIISDVVWDDPSPVGMFGFGRKCLLSSNEQCNANPQQGKPIMTYSNGTGAVKYYAGPCNGVATQAGPTYRACPLFSMGRARWLMLESTNYSDTVASGANIWFFPPITGHPMGPPYKLTDYDPWWVTDYGKLFWIQEAAENDEYALIYVYPGLGLEGTCSFNSLGSPYWRLPPDKNWTYEDGFSLDLRTPTPENISSIMVKIGRDPKCYYEFTVSGNLTKTWSTYSWKFREAERVINSMSALQEPFYTLHDDEYYTIVSLPYEPLPFLNTGFVEVTVSGQSADIYFKNLKNTRTRFIDNMLFLGIDESLYIPDVDILNTGTIELDYYPSEAGVNLTEGDPRDFIYCVLTLSNNEAGLSVILHPYWGWSVYCHTPQEKYRAGFLPVYSEAHRMLPTKEAPGPFHLVLTWAPDKIPGRTDNVVLWVDGGEACSQTMSTLADFFDKGDVKLTLGRGVKAFDLNELHYSYAAYAKFANLKVYKYAVPFPSAEIDNEIAIPENLLELSLDGNRWASFSQGNLPLVSTNVKSGDCIEFFMRNKRPRQDIKKLQRRNTAYLSVMWEVNAS